MSIYSVQAYKFYSEVASNLKVYTIRDEGGYPAPKNTEGKRVQPFWSSHSRVERIIKNVSAYNGFEIVTIDWKEFNDKWIPRLEEDGLLVGVNWSGKRAIGFDIDPKFVLSAVQSRMKYNSD